MPLDTKLTRTKRPEAVNTESSLCIGGVVRPFFGDHLVRNGSGKGMSALNQPSAEAETAALTRDFQNREFITDFSLSVQQLASFVSRFGMLCFLDVS